MLEIYTDETGPILVDKLTCLKNGFETDVPLHSPLTGLSHLDRSSFELTWWQGDTKAILQKCDAGYATLPVPQPDVDLAYGRSVSL